MNLIEMLTHFVWFASGFVPGYFVASAKGIVPGLIIGFITFLLMLFLFNRFRMTIDRKTRR